MDQTAEVVVDYWISRHQKNCGMPGGKAKSWLEWKNFMGWMMWREPSNSPSNIFSGSGCKSLLLRWECCGDLGWSTRPGIFITISQWFSNEKSSIFRHLKGIDRSLRRNFMFKRVGRWSNSHWRLVISDTFPNDYFKLSQHCFYISSTPLLQLVIALSRGLSSWIFLFSNDPRIFFMVSVTLSSATVMVSCSSKHDPLLGFSRPLSLGVSYGRFISRGRYMLPWTHVNICHTW